jgi:peptide/nickel transport system permease protein
VNLMNDNKNKKQKNRFVGRVSLMMIVGSVITAVWILIAIFAPILAPYEPNALNFNDMLQAPGFSHWLGTDNFGRDILSRIIYGTRVDLMMGLIGVIAPMIIGLFIGLLAGYFGGIVDQLLMRVLDVAMAFPYYVLVLAIMGILGPGLYSYYISLTIVAWVTYARLTRTEVLVLRNTDFVLAARTLGINRFRIIFRHVLPNVIAPSIVFVMTDIVLVILLGSALGFLGLGVQPPTAEWGVMIAEGRPYISSGWWICLFPGLAIASLALGFSLLGDGLIRYFKLED